MKKLYLRSVRLNSCKGLTELYELVKKESGYAVSDWRERIEPTYIYNSEDGNKFALVAHFTNYINFVLDGYLYDVELCDNPFFASHYSKVKINDKGVASKDIYMDDLNKVYFDYNMTDAAIKESAKELLEFLKKSEPSEKYVEREKKRICNFYDNGYHYEMVVKPERRGTYKKLELVEVSENA